MKKYLSRVILSVLLVACSNDKYNHFSQKYPASSSPAALILTATPDAQAVLAMADKMVSSGEIIRGGCWDYINTLFNRAGYPPNRRQTIFNGRKEGGPYANIDNVQTGDWLYFINHSYHHIEHSSMFIRWIDKTNHQGLMLSYAGEGKAEPARYRVYELSHIYRIIRAGK